ncbi:BT_3044 domain-containing protein [Phocaeicola paurosaccharolyticus]|uniref:BT_3044 domain-containing protein n=1 Tax=Phocaeicola paurosaccharolyticus TaxID=732242 RepID=UPI000556194D|nr:DUF4361 domain-containing protein [Phocaeicola paurosaccharolyticus]
MKKIAILSATLITVLMASCDSKIPMEEALWPESVYLVGAKDKIVDKQLNIGYENDTIYASIAISGSQPTSQDVTISILNVPSMIEQYNKKERGSDDIMYRALHEGIYNFPQENAIVKKGDTYGTYPILINPSTLHVDSLYMIALKIDKSSAFDLVKEDTVVLYRLNLMNNYSGQYYMDGIIKSVDNPNDSTVYKLPRTLQAVKDGNTVRMYHQKNEWSKGATDYRPKYCFTMTVNSDNSVTLKTWDQFELISGGGKYYPEMKVYDIWYTFKENGETKKVRGFVYKERENDDQVRLINDWMDENRKYDY